MSLYIYIYIYIYIMDFSHHLDSEGVKLVTFCASNTWLWVLIIFGPADFSIIPLVWLLRFFWPWNEIWLTERLSVLHILSFKLLLNIASLYVPCIVYNLLFRPTYAQYSNVYFVNTPICFDVFRSYSRVFSYVCCITKSIKLIKLKCSHRWLLQIISRF